MSAAEKLDEPVAVMAQPAAEAPLAQPASPPVVSEVLPQGHAVALPSPRQKVVPTAGGMKGVNTPAASGAPSVAMSAASMTWSVIAKLASQPGPVSLSLSVRSQLAGPPSSPFQR